MAVPQDRQLCRHGGVGQASRRGRRRIFRNVPPQPVCEIMTMSRNEPDVFSFVVEGSGRFPYDMLRYDQCWPMTSIDSAAMDYEPGETGRRRITLETFG